MLSISTTAHFYFFQFSLSWLSLQHFFYPTRTYSSPISWPPVLTFQISQILFYRRKLSSFPYIHLQLPLPRPPHLFPHKVPTLKKSNLTPVLLFSSWPLNIGEKHTHINTHTPPCSTSCYSAEFFFIALLTVIDSHPNWNRSSIKAEIFSCFVHSYILRT